MHRDPEPPDKVFCPFCGNDVPFETCKPTNADRIRAMTDEELAEYLSDTEYVSYETGIWESQTSWLDWLKQEVSEDG